jgi:hypothetical protein
MARKTAVHTSNAEQALDDFRRQARLDASAERAETLRGLLPTLAEYRAMRDQITGEDLLRLAKSAARLELRGAMFSADDRDDVAAELCRRALLDTGGALPRRDSAAAQLGTLCMAAKNLRRAIVAQRERDQSEADRKAMEYAESPAALGADHTPAEHAALLARSSRANAANAAGAVCRLLGVDDRDDSATWSVLYQWARGATGAVCGDERGATRAAFSMRVAAGAKFLRGFFSARDLAAKLTLGASESANGLRIVVSDQSRKAHPRTRMLAEAPNAPHWREGTNAGRHAERCESAEQARATCQLAHAKIGEYGRRSKRVRDAARGSESDRLAARARSLGRLASMHARAARGKSPASPAVSTLARGLCA